MVKPEIPLKGGLEYDGLTRWRHTLCYMKNKHSIVRWVKRKYEKRLRQHTKRKIRDEL